GGSVSSWPSPSAMLPGSVESRLSTSSPSNRSAVMILHEKIGTSPPTYARVEGGVQASLSRWRADQGLASGVTSGARGDPVTNFAVDAGTVQLIQQLMVEGGVDLHGDIGTLKGAGEAERAVGVDQAVGARGHEQQRFLDRKSTRLNSSHVKTSYAVFCLKK